MPFRPATEADHQGIITLLRDAFAWPAHRFGSSRYTCPIYPATYDVPSLLRDCRAGYEFHVWEAAAQMQRCVPLPRTQTPAMALSRLAVRPDMDRHGIGTRMVAYAAELAR